MTKPSAVPKSRILLVDDDDVLRRWLRAQLEGRGYEVCEEAQGDEALATFERNGPWYFVITDLYFFRGERIRNGLDLVRAILALRPRQRLAIHSSETRIEAPCATLHKPYAIDALLTLVRQPARASRRRNQ